MLWVCSKYEDFLLRGFILVSKLLNQGYSSWKLHLLFGMFMVVIQTLLINLTFMYHIYVEGFDHQM